MRDFPVHIRGELQFRVRSESGRVLFSWSKPNTITSAAADVVRSLVAQRAVDPTAAQLALGSMRFGTSSTVPTIADTDLWSEVVGVRKQLIDGRKVNGSSGELILLATLESGDGNGNTFAEAGLFTTGAAWNADVGGNLQLYSRQVYPAQLKIVGQSFEYEWIIQFTV